VKKSIPEHIIEIAAQLFAEKGFAGVSLQEIATIAEVEYADISQRFKSISEIYGAVLESLFELYARSMSVAFEGSHNSLDNVESFARAFCTLHKQSPHLFKLFYRELLDPSVYFESIVLKNVRHVAYLSDTNIAKGSAEGNIQVRSESGNCYHAICWNVSLLFPGKRTNLWEPVA